MVEQVDIAESVDRISSLPDAILRHILSFLPTKFVVSSCILSTRWRHLFPVSNSLDFDESLVLRPKRDRPNVGTDRFMDFVDRCIMLMNGTRVDKFRLKCVHVNTLRVNSWICTAPLRNVQELDLCIPRGPQRNLVSVFTCTTLVVLKLFTGELDVPPCFNLPSLKTLHLDSVTIYYSDDSIVRLLASCPLLEELSIVRCHLWNVNFSSPSLKRLTIDQDKGGYNRIYEFVLDAPSLLYLKCTFSARGCHTFKDLHSLSEAHITIDNPWWSKDRVALPEFFEGISSVKSLYLSGILVEDLLKGWDELPLCKNLTRLEFTRGTTLKPCVLMKFLQCCPNLEEFVFHESMKGEYNYGCADVPSCTRLKLIECQFYFDAGENTRKNLELLEYLMKNCNELEKIRIYLWWCLGLSYEEAIAKFDTMFGTMKELAKAPGRSKSCKFEVTVCKVPVTFR